MYGRVMTTIRPYNRRTSGATAEASRNRKAACPLGVATLGRLVPVLIAIARRSHQQEELDKLPTRYPLSAIRYPGDRQILRLAYQGCRLRRGHRQREYGFDDEDPAGEVRPQQPHEQRCPHEKGGDGLFVPDGRLAEKIAREGRRMALAMN